MVSLHADGAPTSDHGFHVIAPKRRKPWTTDIATASLRLAKTLRTSLTRGGIPRSNYIGGGTGLDIRSDLGTLNMSDVPVAMIEIGNMRNSTDAQRMTSAKGRVRYAARSSGEFGPICDAEAMSTRVAGSLARRGPPHRHSSAAAATRRRPSASRRPTSRSRR